MQEVDLVLIKSTSRFACNTVAPASSIRKLKEKGVGVNFEKEYIQNGRNPLFSRISAVFLCLFVAYLSLKSTSRYKKMIDNIGIYTVILFAVAFLLNAATSTLRGGQTDAKTMS